MTKSEMPVLSVVVPLFNESAGLETFHESLIVAVASTVDDFEIIYCDDGSVDDTAELAAQLCDHDESVKLIKLSRNFGKENALSAGIAEAKGQAVLMIDGDGQHPVELIGDFIKAWHDGAKVVIGVRSANSDEGWVKRLGSKLFYALFNKLSGQTMLAGATDFRLIDKSVQQAFNKLTETDRITRGLIDWLGFEREYVYFRAKPRTSGSAGYSPRKLASLAVNSFVSLSIAPLYVFGYLGIFITIAATILGCCVFIEQLILGDPWHWNFTGTAMLGILIIFLVGIVLLSQGVISLYISHLHNQSRHRPLYVIDYAGSKGIKTKRDHS